MTEGSDQPLTVAQIRHREEQRLLVRALERAEEVARLTQRVQALEERLARLEERLKTLQQPAPSKPLWQRLRPWAAGSRSGQSPVQRSRPKERSGNGG